MDVVHPEGLMKSIIKFITRTSLVVAALALTGCSGGDSHEKVADAVLVQMERMATAVSSVTDKATAEKAVTELKSVGEEMKNLAEKVKAMKDPSAEVQAKIEAKMKAKQEEIQKKMMGMQANLTKAGPEAAAILMGGMAEFGKVMEEAGKAFTKK
ncbi:MAG: hypothetical protein RL088_2904 [Verrucomicrobiota bacterium]